MKMIIFSERCRSTLRGHADSVNSIQFLHFANTLLTSSADKTLSLWDARTVRELFCFVNNFTLLLLSLTVQYNLDDGIFYSRYV